MVETKPRRGLDSAARPQNRRVLAPSGHPIGHTLETPHNELFYHSPRNRYVPKRSGI